MKTWTREIGAAARKDPRTYAIIGAAMEVHKHLGCGFLEPVYQESLTVELSERSVPYRREVELPVFYKKEETQDDVSCRFYLFRFRDR